MFIFATKLTKTKIMAIIIACGVALSALIIGISEITASTQAAADVRYDFDSDQGRCDYLKKLGWEVEANPVEFMEIQLPSEFDDVYVEYNEIQKSQGMDLKKYRGKRVMKYTYKITNYPTGEKDVYVNMLVYKGKLIAGDICSARLDGFMHGLVDGQN